VNPEPPGKAARSEHAPTPTAGLPIDWDDILAAEARIKGAVSHTPSAHSRTLSQLLGCHLVIKFENLQFTGAFKERGALNKLLLLSDDETRRGVVAMSAGNHAQALAYHADRLGIDATIVMPGNTPFVKVQRTRELGARVVLAGEGLADAEAELMRIVDSEGRTPVHPFDDPVVIAGQGTCAVELIQDHPDLDTLVVPVGGGGLLAGSAVAARHLQPKLQLVGVQAARYPAMADDFHGRPPTRDGASHAGFGGMTLADGIAVPRPGGVTGPILRGLVDDIVTVSEEDIEAGINLLLEIEKVVSEGAGAAAIAAVLSDPDRFADRRIGVVLTGGNIDPRLLASVIMRGLIRNSRLSRLCIELPDIPGALGEVSTVIGETGANIVEVHHQRTFVDVSARSAEVEVTIETLDSAHVERVVAALERRGYTVQLGSFVYYGTRRGPTP
jgi:threonine dehydratase